MSTKNYQVITDDADPCDNCGEVAWHDGGSVGGERIAECDECYATVIDRCDDNEPDPRIDMSDPVQAAAQHRYNNQTPNA